jgi:hypothetical protein
VVSTCAYLGQSGEIVWTGRGLDKSLVIGIVQYISRTI